jgi:23S rRNA pseudouridine2457 synthase
VLNLNTKLLKMTKIILLNKPFKVMCQFTDQQGRATLGDYITDKNVYAAGRLDYDSEGLVVLTDDGMLQQQISNPKTKMAKTYWAQVDGSPTDADLIPLQEGIRLKDGLCRPAKVCIIESPNIWNRNPPIRERKEISTTWLEIVISEGRNRQVRRMTAAIGYPTLRLVRVKIGEWSVLDLEPGSSRLIQLQLVKKPPPKAARTYRRH